LSIIKIKKELSKYIDSEALRDRYELYPGEIFLVTDSKSKYLNPVIPGRLKAYLHIYHEAGATITSNVVDRAIKSIKQTHKPIVLLWLGTCELTKKVGNLVKIRDSPYQTTEFTLTNYREKK
jgi:hypothetical protein